MKKIKILLPIMLFALCSCGETTDNGNDLAYDVGIKYLQECTNNVDTFDAIGFNEKLDKLNIVVSTETYKINNETDEQEGDKVVAEALNAKISGEFDVALSGLTTATSFEGLKASLKASGTASVSAQGENVFGNKESINLAAQAVLDEGNVYVDASNEDLQALITSNAGVTVPEKFYVDVPFPEDSSVEFPLFKDTMVEGSIEAIKIQINELIKKNSSNLTDEQLDTLTKALEDTIASFISFKEYKNDKYEVSLQINKTNLSLAISEMAKQLVRVMNPEATEDQVTQMASMMSTRALPYIAGIDHINMSAMFTKTSFISSSADIDAKVLAANSTSSGTDSDLTTVTNVYADLELVTSATMSFGKDVKVLSIANKEEYVNLPLSE